jgi:predicted metal-binding membrane protein
MLGVAGWMLCVAAVGWVVMARTGMRMGGMGKDAMPMSPVAGALVFAGMWLGMVVAMMFPVAIPIVAAHWFVSRRLGRSPSSTACFVAGYLLVWCAAGVVPLLFVLSTTDGDVMSAPGWPTLVVGIVIVLAGCYELTPVKTYCLSRCRTPLHFVLTHDFGARPRHAVGAGARFGGYCFACCAGLVAVQAVVGVMNVLWMATLTLVFLVERLWRHGPSTTRLAGVALLGLGIAVVLHVVTPATLAV